MPSVMSSLRDDPREVNGDPGHFAVHLPHDPLRVADRVPGDFCLHAVFFARPVIRALTCFLFLSGERSAVFVDAKQERLEISTKHSACLFLVGNGARAVRLRRKRAARAAILKPKSSRTREIHPHSAHKRNFPTDRDHDLCRAKPRRLRRHSKPAVITPTPTRVNTKLLGSGTATVFFPLSLLANAATGPASTANSKELATNPRVLNLI